MSSLLRIIIAAIRLVFQYRVTYKCMYHIFMFLALAVYVRSPAAYEALKSFKVLQLPSRSRLQSYTGAFLHDPGVNSSCIDDHVAQFVLFCQRRIAEGK